MSKKKVNPHEPVRVINGETKSVRREQHVKKEKTQGDVVVKWIFGVLLLLAIIYMIWSASIVG